LTPHPDLRDRSPDDVSIDDINDGGVLLSDAHKLYYGLVDGSNNPLDADLEFEAVVAAILVLLSIMSP